jgi:hypothetical protein
VLEMGFQKYRNTLEEAKKINGLIIVRLNTTKCLEFH